MHVVNLGSSAPNVQCSTATIHGCARTIWAAAGIYRAKDFVEIRYDNPVVSVLIGEVELCLLWECIAHTAEFTPAIVNEQLDQWTRKWQFLLDDVQRGM